MGSRGAYDKDAQCIPLERREFIQIGTFKNLKIIESIKASNGPTPVMSNSPNAVYAVWSDTACRIKKVYFYKKHILVKEIDLEGSKSH